MIEIRRAEDSDFDAIWEIFHEVVQGGDTYVYAPDIAPPAATFQLTPYAPARGAARPCR